MQKGDPIRTGTPSTGPRERSQEGGLLRRDQLVADELLAGGQLDTFVGAVVDADGLVLDDHLAEHLHQVGLLGQQIDGLQRTRDRPGLDGAITQLGAPNRTPGLMSTDPLADGRANNATSPRSRGARPTGDGREPVATVLDDPTLRFVVSPGQAEAL